MQSYLEYVQLLYKIERQVQGLERNKDTELLYRFNQTVTDYMDYFDYEFEYKGRKC